MSASHFDEHRRMLLWATWADAFRYAEARFLVHGRRQAVKKDGPYWHVRGAV